MVGEVTFLLGAGFSKPFGGPLVFDLHDIVSEKPKMYFDMSSFEVRDYTLRDIYSNTQRFHDEKELPSTKEQIEFFTKYKSFLVAEYLKVKHSLPSYELVLGQMSRDTLLFDIYDNPDYTNYPRRNKIIELGDFIESKFETNSKYYNLIINCLDFLTLLVFHRIKESIDTEQVPEPLITEYIKKSTTNVNILSLNYDNIVEDLLLKNGIEYSDGFENEKWDISEFPIYKFNASSFEVDKVKLFKLHGSINYGFVGINTVGKYIETTTIRFNSKDMAEIKSELKAKEGYTFHNREFIIGSYNKAEKYFRRTFIDLFNIGISKLNLSDTLIVIGYSFQDIPINLIISNWLKKNVNNKMIVINGNYNGTEIPISNGRAIFNSHLKDQVIDTKRLLEEMDVNELIKINNRKVNNKIF